MFLAKKFELGRSMIEMSGVLVVMAAITLGVIGGWQFAMRKMFVNSIVYDVQAIDVQNQTDARTEPDLPASANGVSYELIKNKKGHVIAYRVTGERFDSKICQEVAIILGDKFSMYDECEKGGK